MSTPKDGLPGVHPDSLLRINTGVYGLREAPRLWYLKANRILREAGWEELKTARSCYVLRDKKNGNQLDGMLLLYVDDACFGGGGKYYEQVMKKTLEMLTVGKVAEKEFDFLGRHVTQLLDFSIEVDMEKNIRGIERVMIPMARRKQPQSPLTPKELHDYRSIVGQPAWPARQVMPQLAYHVSDLQQKTSQATVHDLVHANHVLEWAKQWGTAGIRLNFLPLEKDVSVNMLYHAHDHNHRFTRIQERRKRLGLGAIHDASFAGQPNLNSQTGYMVLLGPTTFWDSKQRTHWIEWNVLKYTAK